MMDMMGLGLRLRFKGVEVLWSSKGQTGTGNRFWDLRTRDAQANSLENAVELEGVEFWCQGHYFVTAWKGSTTALHTARLY